MCEALAAATQHPLIMPLSRVSPSGEAEASEVSAADALAWTQGRALFADKLTAGEVAVPGGDRRLLRALDTTYIFPGERTDVGWLQHVAPNQQERTRVSCWGESPRTLRTLEAGQQLAPEFAWPTLLHAPPPAGLALGLMVSRSTRVCEGDSSGGVGGHLHAARMAVRAGRGACTAPRAH